MSADWINGILMFAGAWLIFTASLIEVSPGRWVKITNAILLKVVPTLSGIMVFTIGLHNLLGLT